MTQHRALTDMLVRAAPEVVYDAFVEPDVLTKFWLNHASDRLAVGETVEGRSWPKAPPKR